MFIPSKLNRTNHPLQSEIQIFCRVLIWLLYIIPTFVIDPIKWDLYRIIRISPKLFSIPSLYSGPSARFQKPTVDTLGRTRKLRGAFRHFWVRRSYGDKDRIKKKGKRRMDTSLFIQLTLNPAVTRTESSCVRCWDAELLGWTSCVIVQHLCIGQRTIVNPDRVNHDIIR